MVSKESSQLSLKDIFTFSPEFTFYKIARGQGCKWKLHHIFLLSLTKVNKKFIWLKSLLSQELFHKNLNNVLSLGSLRLNKLHSSLNYILLSTALTEIFSLTLVQNALIFCWPIGMLIFWYYGNCRIAPSETSKNIYSVQGKIKLPSKRKFNLEKG